MAWDKSKGFLEKVQLSSIILYLICLGGYTIDAVEKVYDQIRADIFGFTFFCLFIASTILLRFEEEDVAESRRGAVAQLGERGLCKPEVGGSIPLCSTI